MKKLLFLCGIFLLISCNKDVNITRSFCYWKTSYEPYSIDDDKADSLGISHIYMRLFDVGWNPYEQKPLPVATLWNFKSYENRREVTPSIYITNDVVLNCNRQQLAALADNVVKRINKIIELTRKDIGDFAVEKYKLDDRAERSMCEAEETRVFDTRIKEVLIDCDWTGKSRDNYFYLLSRIKKALPQYKISATIRLWQYRDYKTAGIPPVDRGLLMCYNMDNPASTKTANSIGSSKVLKQYINHDNYPLKLDVALPVFSWNLVFRGKDFLGIMNDDYFSPDTPRFKKIAANRYVFTQDKVLGETYYRNGDEVRVEKVSDEEMRKMIDILKDEIDLENSRVTFFSWDENYIQQYGIKTISGYYSLFSR